MTGTDTAMNSRGLNESKTGHMEWERIRKRPATCVGANLLDHDEYAKTFSWAQARGLPPVGIGSGSVIERAIVDKNARIGRGVRIANETGVLETDGPGYYIRDGIVIVPKDGVIPDGTVI